MPGQNRTWHLSAAIGTINDVNLSLQDRVALVAGSSGALGKKLPRRFCAKAAMCVSPAEVRRRCPRRSQNSKPSSERNAPSPSAADPLLIQPRSSRRCARPTELWRRLDVVVANLGSGSGQTGWHLESEEVGAPLPDKFLGKRKPGAIRHPASCGEPPWEPFVHRLDHRRGSNSGAASLQCGEGCTHKLFKESRGTSSPARHSSELHSAGECLVPGRDLGTSPGKRQEQGHAND